MVIIGGADETVVGDVHQLPQVKDALRAGDNVVHELLGGDAGFSGLVLDLLTVLVGTGEEHDVVALEPLEPGHGVRCHGAVGMADMQLGGRIVNGCGNVEITLALVAHKYLLLKKNRPGNLPRATIVDAVPP